MLGRLTPVPLREIWKSEAIDFTPWLAREENISVLAEALSIDLEVEATERPVGPFRADILCKDLQTNNWVLIENQLERTDHIHLGQLLTYASGLDAVTIIWIAASFTDEHRSTLDWLNRITRDSFQFFGLEVELWKIGDSPAAPKFNVVCQPNDWARSVAKATNSIERGEPTELRLIQREYWEALHDEMNATGGRVSGNRTPQLQNWMNYPIGRTGFSLVTVMQAWEKYVRADLYLNGKDAKNRFALLEEQKPEIEAQLGYPLVWDQLQGKDSRIWTSLPESDPLDRADWPRQHRWLAATLNQLHAVFADRIRALP